jgi:molybdopterin adenylyltransferase
MTDIPIGIVVSSDRAASGVYADLGGPAIIAYLARALTTPWRAITLIVPDERHRIEDAIVRLTDIEGCPLVLTTGGTGPAPRDVTPDVMVDVCQRMMPGFGEAMRLASLREVPTAILSRQTAGIRGTSLIVNLPGKPASIATCLDAVLAAVPYCIDLIGGPRLETDPSVCRAFRPGS